MTARITRALLLDAHSVFSEFLHSNRYQGRCWTFDELMSIPLGHKRYLRFEHDQVPYLATVLREGLHFGDCVTLKLPNNGFIYSRKGGGVEVFRHKCHGWRQLGNAETLHAFASVLQRTRPAFCEAKVWYNYRAQRVDLLFKPAEAYGLHFRITYEPGSPYTEDDHPWQPLPA